MNNISRNLFGRRQIFTKFKAINADNVVEALLQAISIHALNRDDINYLYRYYKGDQPILYREKEVRPEITNCVVENRALEIVSFKTGYLCGEPIQYIARNGDDSIAEEVSALNDMMLLEDKATKDTSLVEWQHIAGTAYRMIMSADSVDDDSAPFSIENIDPRDAFVIYSNMIGHKPLCGVYYVYDENDNPEYYVYTKDMFFFVKNDVVVEQTTHYLGGIPIIEYPANNARLGAFEIVLGLLDSLSKVDSNRMDGVEQFIQSLAVAVNCQFEDGTTANDIRRAGMIVLKSVGENKADFKILCEQLNQTETQTLKNDLYQTVLTICGMPSQSNGSSDSSNNGAVILRNGWQLAEARAKESELMFKKPEKEMLKIAIRICNYVKNMHLHVSDIDCKFTRRQYEDILTKTQVLTMMLNGDKIDPQLAFAHCGLFSDPQSAYLQSVAWREAHKEELEEKTQDVSGTNGEVTDESPTD